MRKGCPNGVESDAKTHEEVVPKLVPRKMKKNNGKSWFCMILHDFALILVVLAKIREDGHPAGKWWR